jgi:hypothetical protein
MQAHIAERQLEMQREQMRGLEEQRDLMESRQRQSQPQESFPSKPKVKTIRSLSVIEEEMTRDGGLPDPDEWLAALEIDNREVGEFVNSIIKSDSGKNARSYREVMKEFWDDPDENLPDLVELITAALAHKKMINENYIIAVTVTKKLGKVSIAAIQRQTGTGYNDTVEIIDEMERNGIVKIGEDGTRQLSL